MPAAAVCDDEYEVNREICRLVRECLPDWETAAFLSGEALLPEAKRFDIIFLDIKMKSMNGMETAEKLRERGCNAVIIFVTGLKEYVFSAFDVGAFNYLLKPIDREKFRKTLLRAVKEINARTEGHRLLIKMQDRSVSIDGADIVYLENEMRKIAVHTLTETVRFYGTMSDIESRLGADFYRCHRGYLVNMSYIAEYSSSEIILTNGEKVYVAKGKYPDFLKSYHRFLRGKGAVDEI